MGSFIQFLLLFAQFYIPLTAAYWALFGGNDASHENIHLMAESAVKTGFVQTKKVTHGNTTHLTLAREVDIFYLSSLSEIVSCHFSACLFIVFYSHPMVPLKAAITSKWPLLSCARFTCDLLSLIAKGLRN